MLIQPDGKIVIGGYNDNTTDNDMMLVRLNTDGSYDTSFDSDGIWADTGFADNQAGKAVAMDPSGKILIAGTTSAGSGDSFVMRVNSDGTVDTSFGTSGRATISAGSPYEDITSIEVLPGGKILIAGNAYNGSNNDVSIIRLNSDGSVDTSFGSSGFVRENLSGANRSG